jgi:hypothetical protein
MDKIIVSDSQYTTDNGRRLSGKYRKDIEKMAINIRTRFQPGEIDFLHPIEGKNRGIYFGFDLNDKRKSIFIFTSIYTTTEYNTLKTRYMPRAATMFNKYVPTLLRTINEMLPAIETDDDVAGYGITLQWKARDFISERYIGGTLENITLLIPKIDGLAYIHGEITNQELVKRSKVYGAQGTSMLGLIELKLDDAL